MRLSRFPARDAAALLLATVACLAAPRMAAQQSPHGVAIVVYDGVYLMDFAGPMEVFTDASLADTACGFGVWTVSRDGAPVRTHTGLLVTPKYSLADSPRPDVLVIPGGDLDAGEKDTALARWILSAAPDCQVVLSVCTGAFILAKLGLLDGMQATTWHGALNALAKTAPACTVVPDVRWTDNGRLVTTAGISAGIDGALHVVARLCGDAAAVRTARYMDYEYWTGSAKIPAR